MMYEKDTTAGPGFYGIKPPAYKAMIPPFKPLSKLEMKSPSK